MKLLNQIINTYTTPEQRKYLKQMGARGKSIVFNNTMNVMRNTVKELTPQEKAKLKAQGKEGLIKDSQSVSRQIANYETSDKYLQDKFKYLTSPENLKKQGVEKTLAFLGLFGLKGIPKNQAFKVLDRLSAAYKKGGSKAVNNTIVTVRNEFVKQNTKAISKIQQGKEAFNKTITDQQAAFDDFLKYAESKGITPKTIDQLDSEIEVLADFYNKYNNGQKLLTGSNQKLLTTAKGKDLDDAFAAILKDNSTRAGKLFEDLGITSKKEIPNGLKFIKEFAELLKNSPKRIKGEQTGSGVSGIDIYDIYQAFKENGNKLIGLTRDQVKKNPILSLTYGSLGLLGTSGLAYVAGKKIFGKDKTLEAEIQKGIAHPGLEEQLERSYFVGQSGKKYHVVGNRAYDYSTGKPAKISEFLDDIESKINFDKKIIKDQIARGNAELAQINKAEQNGYQINPQYKNQLLAEISQLNQDLSNLPTINVDYKDPVLSFDENGDIEEQYQQQVIAPQQQQQAYQQQIAQQQLDDTYKQVVQDVYNRIAQTYAQDADSYFTPQNLAFEYQDYMNKVYMGQAQPMSPERFAEVSKAQYLHQLTPTLVQTAQSQLQALMTGKKDTVDAFLKGSDIAETIRHNKASENNTKYKNIADIENERIKRQQDYLKLLQGQQELGLKQELGYRGLDINQMNAETNRMNAETRQDMVPYQQASYIGNFLSGAAVGDMNINDITGSNPKLFEKVFPGPEQSQQPTNEDKIKLINNYYKGQK